MAEQVHRNYVRIWIVLCVLLGVSILGPTIGIRMLTLITAFGVAILKAYLVAKNFMHLDIEKRWVAYVLVAMIAFIVIMFAGIAPDVMKHDGVLWENTAAKAAVERGRDAGAGDQR
jgi:caa(3)-type oxidase subunit IV